MRIFLFVLCKKKMLWMICQSFFPVIKLIAQNLRVRCRFNFSPSSRSLHRIKVSVTASLFSPSSRALTRDLSSLNHFYGQFIECKLAVFFYLECRAECGFVLLEGLEHRRFTPSN